MYCATLYSMISENAIEALDVDNKSFQLLLQKLSFPAESMEKEKEPSSGPNKLSRSQISHTRIAKRGPNDYKATVFDVRKEVLSIPE